MLTGVGVGLTLPTFMAAGASALPPHSFATGSALINMLRQIGLAIGVAVLIAILGSARSPHQAVDAYQSSSVVIAALAIVAGVIALVLLAPRFRPEVAAAPVPGAAVAGETP